MGVESKTTSSKLGGSASTLAPAPNKPGSARGQNVDSLKANDGRRSRQLNTITGAPPLVSSNQGAVSKTLG